MQLTALVTIYSLLFINVLSLIWYLITSNRDLDLCLSGETKYLSHTWSFPCLLHITTSQPFHAFQLQSLQHCEMSCFSFSSTSFAESSFRRELGATISGPFISLSSWVVQNEQCLMGLPWLQCQLEQESVQHWKPQATKLGHYTQDIVFLASTC
jgi:hypothetical protein